MPELLYETKYDHPDPHLTHISYKHSAVFVVVSSAPEMHQGKISSNNQDVGTAGRLQAVYARSRLYMGNSQ